MQGPIGKLGEKSQLAALVDYQPGSVVSRIILQNSAGNITLFAFDADQGLSEHTAPFNAMVYVLEGRVNVRISGNNHELGQGEMIIMPAGEPHALQALEPFKMLLIMIKAND